MDSLEQLNLAAPIVSTYTEIEETILCHIAEQLAANPDTLINATSEWRIKMLAQMGRVNEDTARIIASKVGKIPAEVQQVVQSSIDKVISEHGLEMNGKIEESVAAALKNYDLQAVKDKYNQVNTVMQYKAKQAYVSGINSVADKLLRKEQEALKNSQEYIDILNKNAMATVMGEKSRTEAIRETIAEMSKKGIPAFVDKTGREWSPEAYIDMDIRNTAKNAALAAEFASLDELGQDIILVSSHSGSRPLCAPYQGKLYSRSGKSGTITDAKGKTYTYTPLSDTSFGEAAGLFGINCGHRMRGVSDGTFINREKEFDGEETSEEYKKVQQQRALEREVRKKKTEANMLEAAGEKDAARDLRRLALDDDRKLRAYCEKEGLHYRRDRTEVYGYKNKVDISENSGIIKEKDDISVKLGELEKVYSKNHSEAITEIMQKAPKNARAVWNDCSDDFHILDPDYKGKKAHYDPNPDGVLLNISSASKGSDYQTSYQVLFHENGHHIDYILNRKYYSKGTFYEEKALSERYKGGLFGRTLKEEGYAAVKKFADENGYDLPNLYDKINSDLDKLIEAGVITPGEREREAAIMKSKLTIDIPDDIAKAFCLDMKSKLTKMQRADISDMFEPIMPKSCSFPFGYGHGTGYWGSRGNSKEGFAEMYSALVSNPESLEQIKKYFPESYRIFEEMLEVINK